MSKLILGIDPGKVGAIVYTTGKGDFGYASMPKSLPGLQEHLRMLRFNSKATESLAFIEHVGGFFIGNLSKKQLTAFTKQDLHKLKSVLQRTSANLKLREQLGELRASCVACGITVVKEPRPTDWMRPLNLRQKDSAKRKKEIFELMCRRHPDWNFPQYAGDAVAILDYGITHMNQ